MFKSEGDLVLNPIKHKLCLWVLENHPDVAAHHPWPEGQRIVAENPHHPGNLATAEVWHQPVEAAQQGGFAATRRANDQGEATRRDAQTHVG